MFKRYYNLLPFLIFFGSFLFAKNVDDIIKKAESYRIRSNSVKVETEVKLYKEDVLYKSNKYRVFIKPGRRSLIKFLSAQESGQKVLMIQDKFWILMPSSRRPIRITPMQKLLGEASTGDIAIMTWSEFYSGKIVDLNTTYAEKPAILLELNSKVKGTTYERIELWVSKEKYIPFAANLFLKSGKMAKKAIYQTKKIDTQIMINRMTLIDNIQKGRRTEVLINSITPYELPDKYFNPMFLVRNDLED